MAQPWPAPNSESESDPASLSQRTSLLSPPHFVDSDDVDALGDLPRHIPRGPGLKFRHTRERVHATASPHDLLRMLVNEEYESQQTRKMLYTAFDRIEIETRRAEAAEARIDETVQRARALNEARAVAQQQAVRAQEELKLYKLQLDNAQKEILRAQDVLKAIEAQRDEAEAAAVSARSKARRLNEERLIELAREEGRRLGFEEGVRRGRKMGHREANSSGGDDRRHEMQQVAAEVVNRLLEERDEPEQIEVLQEPTPVPPPPSTSRTAPQVHRMETPVNSSLEGRNTAPRSRQDSVDDSLRRPPDSLDSTLRHSTDTMEEQMPSRTPPTPTAATHASRPRPNTAPRSRRDSVDSTLRRPADSVGNTLRRPSEIMEAQIPSRTPPIPTTASHASQPRSERSQPWAGTPAERQYARPASIQNSPPSVRHADFHVPPDNYIPTVDENHHISLPPPHEMQRIVLSPTPSQQTLGQTSERGRHDYPYDNYSHPRRASPDESLASTKQSATSTISQLDLLGLPANAKRRERPPGLGVIHEDTSMHSERMTDYSQTIASEAGRRSFRETGSSDTLRRDKRAKQQLADELRYSDPTAAEQWRRDNSRSQLAQDGPPRHRPPHITIPTALSPVQQPDLRHRRTPSERQGRSETRTEYRDQRRLSSESTVPEISVVPPSRSPSDAPSRGRGNAFGLLSPDHAHQPLPVPARPPVMANGRTSPVPGSPGARRVEVGDGIYTVLSDGQLPPGFLPSPVTTHGPQIPVIPQQTQRYAVPGVPRAPSSTDRERETGRSRSPISFYAAAPVPNGVTYPAPPVSRSAGAAYASSNPSLTSEGRPRRRDSLSATAGMTPAARNKPIPTTGSEGGASASGAGGAGVRRRPSTGSVGSLGRRGSLSYSRYDPEVYNDPAYLASNDSFVDSVTDANTAANGGRGRMGHSPGYSYATLRE